MDSAPSVPETPRASAPSAGRRARPRADWVLRALIAACVAVVGLLFHFYGLPYTEGLGRSLFRWTFAAWGNKDVYGGAIYWQGYLIPLLAAWMLWRQRGALAEIRRRPAFTGLLFVAFGLALHWAGLKSEQARISIAALLLILWAMGLALHGWRYAEIILFPVFLLVFCIPLYFLDFLVYPMRTMATQFAVLVVNAFDVYAESRGAEVLLGLENQVRFEALDEYSSIHVVLGIAVVAALVGHMTQRTVLMGWLLFFLALPVAFLSNLLRIIVVAAVGHYSGQATVDAVLRWSGAIVYPIALILVALAAILLRRFSWTIPWPKKKKVDEDRH